jgi:hypothetical protein
VNGRRTEITLNEVGGGVLATLDAACQLANESDKQTEQKKEEEANMS